MPAVKLGRKIVPANDLLISDPASPFLTLNTDEVQYVLALLQGMGPTNPHLVAVDETGRLLLGNAGALIGGINVMDAPASSANIARILAMGDNSPQNMGMIVHAIGHMWNGASQDRVYAASAANLAAKLGIGVSMSTPPGMWSAVSTPAAGVLASATQAAGGAGIRHIATGAIITWGAIAAPVATVLQWNLRDGASGLGTILVSGQLAVPAAVFQGQPVTFTDVAIPGTPNTAMTLEFSSLLANLVEGVTLLGFDSA